MRFLSFVRFLRFVSFFFAFDIESINGEEVAYRFPARAPQANEDECDKHRECHNGNAREHLCNICCTEKKMARQGILRPVFLMIIGWLLAVKRVHTAHSEPITGGTFILLPAYCFFYTMYVSLGFALMYQEYDRRQPSDEATKCSDYFNDVYDKFGFVVDSYSPDNNDRVVRASNFMVRMLAVFAIQSIAAIVFAWKYKPKKGVIVNINKNAKAPIHTFALVSLAIGIFAFVGITLSLPVDEDPDAAADAMCALA